MRTVSRPKKTAPRDRCVTLLELADEAERWRRAREKARQAPEPMEGNLCAVLVTFAAWRPCCVCGSLTLYVNENARTDSDFECGLCKEIRENLAKRLRRPSLPLRVGLHLRALFSTANDNAAVSV
jgi:hypothetical protein